MSRTISSETSRKVAKAVTKPYYLVYIGLTTPVYYTNGPSVIYDGNTYTSEDIVVSNLDPDKGIGTLKVGNTDYIFGGLVSDENGITGISIKIYKYYE